MGGEIKMVKRFWIIIFLLIVPSLQAEPIYKWIDKSGVVHFTDDLEKVPMQYRDQIQKIEPREEKKDVQKGEPLFVPSSATPTVREKKETDIYGRDEAWWRERVRPWREQLREATENLENARRKFADKTVEMGRKGLVSRARYQIEAEKYDQEKKKYEAQIAEAQEMLEKLSREAEEAKANPEWLK